MLKGFREFIMRGNVVDLAVGVVIGAAFGKLVDKFVDAFINPLVRLVTGGNEMSGTWEIRPGIVMDWAGFINAVITFLITAAAVYFFVVVPVNRLRRAKPADDASDEVRLLTEIRDSLSRDGR
ncbi:MAG TPA: large conductance mechanosensitive channel protein MscL [Micromonosporaceae bacterium]|nr:large conductance mechanosensitive channel protein MscL [Micromonosporaceae bacterium]